MEQQIQQLMKRVAVLEYTVAQLSVRLAKLEKMKKRFSHWGKSTLAMTLTRYACTITKTITPTLSYRVGMQRRSLMCTVTEWCFL